MLLHYASSNAQSLLWADEFDGTTLDESIWTYALGDGCAIGICGWGNSELQTYTNQNTRVEEGKLVITARRENLDGKKFTSARLLTRDKVSVKYGMIEASIKLPDMNNGLWPAFWMLGDGNRWPYTGEIDIMEAGFDALSTDVNTIAKTNIFWRAEAAGVTGNLQFGNEDVFIYNSLEESGQQLHEDYFVYRVIWTPTNLTSVILQTDEDGEPLESTAKTIWSIDKSNTFESEFFTGDNFYILLNLAVGGSLPFNIGNGENTEANVTALPTAGAEADMFIDYVRVYDVGGIGEVTLGPVDEEIEGDGGIGIFTETVTVDKPLTFAYDAELFAWESNDDPAMTLETAASPFGTDLYNIVFPANQWAGIGFNSSDVLNLSNYRDGSLRFKMKTSSQEPFRISAESKNGSAGIDFLAGEEKFGLVRDGQWHDVEIPLGFLITDFKNVYIPFIIGNIAYDEPTTDFAFQMDEIYYSSKTTDTSKITPPPGNFGLFTTKETADNFDLGVDGNLYIWEGTLIAGEPMTYNGQPALSYINNNKGWFGLGFTANPNTLYDLSAFEAGHLHLALKTTGTETIEMRINVGLASGLVTFEAGNDPYGFLRDGEWHELLIPISDFQGLDLANVSTHFSINGVGNIPDLAISDLYFVYPESINSPPVADLNASALEGEAPLSISFDGSTSSDPDDDPLSFSWDFGDGNFSNLESPTHIFTEAGVYEVNLVVSDGELSDDEQVTINVTAPPVNDNLALDQPITASTQQSAAFNPDNANDGNKTSRWSSAFISPSWIKVDLGDRYSIDRVVLDWERACAESYYILLSDVDTDPDPNDSNWTIISSQSGMPDQARIDELTQLSGSGRYIAMYATNKLHPWGYSLWEIEVYGSLAPPNQEPIAVINSSVQNGEAPLVVNFDASASSDPDNDPLTYTWDFGDGNTANGMIVNHTYDMAGEFTSVLVVSDGQLTASDQVVITVTNPPVEDNLALNKPAVASSEQSATFGTTNANDGNNGTRWSSDFESPSWIKIDLEKSYDINRVVLNWERASAESYYVLVSDTDTDPDPNDSNWTIISNQSGMSDEARIDELTELSGSGRYIAMYATNKLHPWGYSLWEIEVYGTKTILPEAYWTFEENTNDVSGNGHHGRVVPTSLSAKYSSDAVEGLSSIDHDSTYVIGCHDGSFFNNAITYFTFSCWVKPDNLTGDKIILDRAGPNNGISVWLDDDRLTCTARKGFKPFTIVHGLPIPDDGQWHHIVATFAQGYMMLYLDNQSTLATIASYPTITAHPEPGGIGGAIGETAALVQERYTGLIDAVIYSEIDAWTAADVNAEYNSKNPQNSAASAPNLKMHDHPIKNTSIEAVLYPNPLNIGDLNINLNHSTQGTYNIKIFDTHGRIIFTQSLLDRQNIQIPEEVFSDNGIYIINMTNNNEARSYKVIVSK